MSTASSPAQMKATLIQQQQQLQQQPHARHNSNSSNLLLGIGGDDFILASLVESGFITGTIKTVFERGKQESFHSNLDRFIDRQKTEIQHLCNENYEEFLKSVSQLKSVRSDANILRSKIVELDQKVQEAGKSALESGKKLLMLRTVGENIEGAMELMETCRYVSSLAAKSNRQIQDGKFYGALVTLDELEKLIRSVHEFEFAQFMERLIPKFKLRIKSSVEKSFNVWLSHAKNHSQNIGQRMMSHFDRLREEPSTTEMTMDNDKLIQKYMLNEPTIHIQDVFDDFSFELTPVYTCKHIFETMKLDTFKGYYKRNREIQLDYELGSASSDAKDCSTLKEWLEKMVGFFTIEDAVLHTTSELLSNVEINAMWEKARLTVISRVDILFAQYSDYTGDVSNLNTFLELKHIITMFCYTMSKGPLRHDVSPILEIVAKNRSIFHKDLMIPHSYKLIEERITKNEEYTPIVFSSGTDSDDYKQCMKYGLIPKPDDKSSNAVYLRGQPKASNARPTVPFSKTVLIICMILDKFIANYNLYCQHVLSKSSYYSDLKSGIYDLLEFIHQSIEKLFRSYLNMSDIKSDSSDLRRAAQYAQVVVNVQYIMEYVLPYFAVLIGGKMDSLLIHYQQSKERGEDLILKAVLAKVGSILDQCHTSVDWAPFMATSSNDGTSASLSVEQVIEHQFVLDIVQYLQSTTMVMQYIAKEKREYIMFKAFDSIAHDFTDQILTYPDPVRELNNFSINVLLKDVEYLLRFIKNEVRIEKCQFCFSDIKVLLEFLVKTDINEQELAESGPSYEGKIIETFSKTSASSQQLGRLGAILSKYKMHYYERSRRAKNNLSLKDGIKEITALPSSGLKFVGKLMKKGNTPTTK